jgi:hypothetical protein
VATTRGDDAYAAEGAWDAVANICSTGDAVTSRTRFGEADALASVTETLRRGDGTTDSGVALVCACMGAAATMCGGDADDAAHEANIATAVGEGVVSAVLAAARRMGAASADVTWQAVVLLWRLSRSETARVAIVAAGGVRTVVALMRRHPESHAVQVACGVVLSFYILDDAEVMADDGCIDAVLGSMRRCREVLVVQQIGCRNLRALCDHEPNAAAIARADGVATVLEAMRLDDAAVLEAGMLALAGIMHGSADSELPSAALRRVDAGAAVVAALRRHADDSALQRHGCDALFAIADGAGDRDRKAVAVRGGGAAAVIAAMRHHSDDASVQDRGCCALHGFGNAAPDTCATIVRAGGIDVVLAAMRRFTGSAVVQQAGCLALLTLAVADSHKVAIARAGGIEAVVAAMRRYPEAYDTGCGALWLLAADPDIKAAVIRSGGCSVVVEAKRHGGGGSPSIDLAFKALSQ